MEPLCAFHLTWSGGPQIQFVPITVVARGLAVALRLIHLCLCGLSGDKPARLQTRAHVDAAGPAPRPSSSLSFASCVLSPSGPMHFSLLNVDNDPRSDTL